MKSVVCFLLGCLLAVSVHSQVLNLGSLDTVDFSEDTKTELKRQLKDARVVVLGEQTHGIAEEYLGFSRMVKFLHEEMGFQVLIQEYCFFSTHEVNQQLEANESAQALRQTMYWPQGKSLEYNALFDYLDAQRKLGKPIQVEGFDSRLTQRKTVKQWFDQLLSHFLSPASSSEFKAMARKAIHQVIEREYTDTLTTSNEKERAYELLDQMIEYYQSLPTHGRDVQRLKSLKAFAQNAWNPMGYSDQDLRRYHYREHQMAENLLWLIEEVYQEERIIVHMHNGHAAKNIESFQAYTRDSSGLKNVTVGSLLNERLGAACFIVGTTAYAGNHCRWDFKPIVIPPAHPTSLEAELHRTNLTYCWINLEEHKEPFYLFFNEFNNWVPSSEIKAPYGQMFDALIFYDRVNPPQSLEK
ncbi:erythromycin esterase family protein [bacterium SCSIO 12741]|nr:erythromycin esterase family protein [bacterium SCSIO 12741]